MKPKWYVSFGDGTFVELTELPYVFLAWSPDVRSGGRVD